jgi:Beta-carotene isomerase D27-like, C-terminal
MMMLNIHTCAGYVVTPGEVSFFSSRALGRVLSVRFARPAHGMAFVNVVYSPRTRWCHRKATCRREGSPLLLIASQGRVPGPTSPPPDYSNIDTQPHNRLFMRLFSNRLAEELGVPVPADKVNYDSVMAQVNGLATRAGGRPELLTGAAIRVLNSLFPPWLPPAFAAMFSKPLPSFAAWINAIVTVLVTQWLMGPSRMANDGTNTVEIERCRYLEESGCVGTCLNSCKRPTERFFAQSMGLPLYIEPNFDDLYVSVCVFGLRTPFRRE